MDPVERRPRNRTLRPAIEGMEARCLMAAAAPDIVMVSAKTVDSRSITLDYNITGADVEQPIHFEIDRSSQPQFGPEAKLIGGVDVVRLGPAGGPTRDAAGQPAMAQGRHELTVPLPGGLTPDPQHPYV
ncbi:MAG: hypothetical protein LC745_10440, partial [Planctomycetia bacterium]|nr:hypothetical protein [Planctomycetia bacterium]